MIPDEFVRLAESLAERARETAQRTSNELGVEIKTDGTPVTTLDRGVEAALRCVIEQQQLRGTESLERGSEPKAPIGSGSGSSTLSTGLASSPPASRISGR